MIVSNLKEQTKLIETLFGEPLIESLNENNPLLNDEENSKIHGSDQEQMIDKIETAKKANVVAQALKSKGLKLKK